jgi:hypothetical protein
VTCGHFFEAQLVDLFGWMSLVHCCLRTLYLIDFRIGSGTNTNMYADELLLLYEKSERPNKAIALLINATIKLVNN